MTIAERSGGAGGADGLAPSAVAQHRRDGRAAVRLEARGWYAEAALAWQRVANRAPWAVWRHFARRRAAHCRARAGAVGTRATRHHGRGHHTSI